MGLHLRRECGHIHLHLPDGGGGLPGAVRVEVTYRLADSTLTIEYRAAAEKDTVVNLTNHAYFNLGGHDSGTVDDQVLTVQADHYTPTDGENIPTGQMAEVEGTLLDLRAPTEMKSRLRNVSLNGGHGYDHNYVLNAGQAPAAELWCPATGIGMELTTSMEGMQLYTAGWLTERSGKQGGTLWAFPWDLPGNTAVSGRCESRGLSLSHPAGRCDIP